MLYNLLVFLPRTEPLTHRILTHRKAPAEDPSRPTGEGGKTEEKRPFWGVSGGGFGQSFPTVPSGGGTGGTGDSTLPVTNNYLLIYTLL
jgi:hypothetical protein